jgi:hypothetical protein
VPSWLKIETTMKKIKLIILLITTIAIGACTELPIISVVEILQNANKEWRIVAVKLNGRSISASGYSNVRFRFNSNGATPTTYQVTGAGRAGIADEGDKPNYYSTTNQGSWEVQLGGKVVFEPNTNPNSIVDLSPIPKAGDKTITIRWTVPEELNKSIPTYEMTLESIN